MKGTNVGAGNKTVAGKLARRRRAFPRAILGVKLSRDAMILERMTQLSNPLSLHSGTSLRPT